MSANGNYLPYYETDGYVFKAVEMKAYGKNWAATPGFVDGAYTVWFYNNAASDNYFCDVMANADNELNVIVRATWTSGGITSTQDFVMSDNVEAGYAANKGKGPYMYFDILGLEGLDPVVSVVYQVKVGNFIVEVAN